MQCKKWSALCSPLLAREMEVRGTEPCHSLHVCRYVADRKARVTGLGSPPPDPARREMIVKGKQGYLRRTLIRDRGTNANLTLTCCYLRTFADEHLQ
jgi:hypothetical protein